MAIEIPDMIQIDSTGRNSDKTTLAEVLIKQYQEVYPIYGLKIITISGQQGMYQRGTKGCGICTSITAGYELVEEQEAIGNKDAIRLLVVDCQRVFLLGVLQENLMEAVQQSLKAVPAQILIICESNSLHNVVRPEPFLTISNRNRQRESAKRVIDRADFCLLSAEIPKKLRICYQGEQL